MRSSSITIRRKATWGAKTVLSSVLLLTLTVVAPQPLDAAPKPKGNAKAEQQLTHAERKLDRELRGRAAQGAGETDVIVELTDSGDDGDVIRGFGRKGARLSGMNGRVLRVPNGLLKRLAEHPRVKRIIHDRPVSGDVGRTAATIGSRAVVDLMGYTGAGIGVAVIDSGISGWHDDMRLRGWNQTQPSLLTLASTSLALTGQVLPTNQRVAHFKDFVNGRTTPYDDWGHGTHVSGIIAGNGYDSKNVREAIAPGAHIVSLKALDRDGSGTISSIIAAIDYAISVRQKYNIRVLNMSLGAGVFESYNTDPLTLAAKRAVDAGIVVVASAGNMGKAKNGSPQYGAIGAPGNAPWVLTVGASSTNGSADRRDDTLAAYSSRGPTMIDFAAKPDLVAPGTGTVSLSDPLSKMYIDKTQFLFGGTISGLGYKPYLALSGTSMAAPVVAGTVALMLHANPSLTPNMVKAMLQYTAQVYTQYDYLTQGAGFLNARGAVVLAEYFRTGKPGARYPKMKGWSRHIFWGNRRVSGGVLTPNGTAWANNIVWGDASTPSGKNIVWGDNCTDSGCDNIVWGNNIVWGQHGEDNIVWGNAEGIDNIVWGQSDDNIVWGNTADDNVSWGNAAEDVHFGDDTSELETFDSSIWDSLFELTTDDPFGAGTPPPTGPTVETVTPAEPVESTAPALTTTITLLQGGLL